MANLRETVLKVLIPEFKDTVGLDLIKTIAKNDKVVEKVVKDLGL